MVKFYVYISPIFSCRVTIIEIDLIHNVYLPTVHRTLIFNQIFIIIDVYPIVEHLVKSLQELPQPSQGASTPMSQVKDTDPVLAANGMFVHIY